MMSARFAVLPVVLALAASPALGQENPKVTAQKADAVRGVDEMAKMAQEMVDSVFSFGELGMQEVETSRYLTGMLEKYGFTIQRGVDSATLEVGPGHYKQTAMPGEQGNFAVAGHRVGKGAPFNDMDLLSSCDAVVIETIDSFYVYRVLLTGIHLMRTGVVEANLRRLNHEFGLRYIPDLIERKIGGAERSTLDDADMAFHAAEFARLDAMLHEAGERTHLPDEPGGRDELDDLLVRLRMATIEGE